MLVRACTSQVLSEDEAGDSDDESWDASTADSCCVIIASDNTMNDTSLDRG